MKRVRWYHYYILLAAFDLLIIAASLWLHRQTLASFEDLLNGAASLDASQRDLTALGLRLVALNAPGNDVFETRQVATERQRFRRLRDEVERMRHTSHIQPGKLRRFWEEIDRMCAVEERIFELIEVAQAKAAQPAASSALVQAGNLMSIMDRHQARAIRLLGSEQETTMNRAAETLWSHQQVLQRHQRLELVFVAAMFLALVGMFCFFWKLQRTDETLLAEQQRAETERRERLATVGELCSSVAHGIQNPLAAIRSSTELILDMGKIDSDSRRRAENVMTECVRLSTRVKRLLDFSRAEERLRQPVNILDSLEKAIEELRARFAEQGVALETTAEGPNAAVLADPDELATVFIELLSNALDHSSRGDRVLARLHSNMQRAIVDICDCGPGVPSSAADKIFDLFFTTKAGGTGIGLASVRRIVRSMGGQVELASAPGHTGCIFRVTLPRLDSAGPGSVQPETSSPSAQS